MSSTAAASAANDDSAWGATQTPSVEQFETTAKQIGTLMTSVRETTDIPQGNAVRLPGYTLDRLMNAPLDRVLTDLNAQVIEIDMPYPSYFGGCFTRSDGRRLLAMPAGRDAFERTTIARYLLAEAIGLDVTPLPAPFNTVMHPVTTTAVTA
ncbi:hypothetical protein ACIBKZ_17955 [Streptomyces sp. NPDC050421]|uniref:hypothetical protein n=1 Tax=Streptomyces sp. NPDC050421 TaxID=3365613 RepID=UPI0037968FEF